MQIFKLISHVVLISLCLFGCDETRVDENMRKVEKRNTQEYEIARWIRVVEFTLNDEITKCVAVRVFQGIALSCDWK